MCLSNGVLWFSICLMGRLLLSSAGYFVTAEVKHFLFSVYVQDFNSYKISFTPQLPFLKGQLVQKKATAEPFLTVFQFTALLFVHLNSVIIYLFVYLFACLSRIH